MSFFINQGAEMLRTLAVLRAEFVFGSLYRRSNGLDLTDEKNLVAWVYRSIFDFLKYLYIIKENNMKILIMIVESTFDSSFSITPKCGSFPWTYIYIYVYWLYLKCYVLSQRRDSHPGMHPHQPTRKIRLGSQASEKTNLLFEVHPNSKPQRFSSMQTAHTHKLNLSKHIQTQTLSIFISPKSFLRSVWL